MKNNIREKIKEEKAAVTLLVFVTVLTFVAVLLGGYLTVTTLRQSQLKSDSRIQEIYGENVNSVDEVYQELIDGIDNVQEIKKLKESASLVEDVTIAKDKLGNRIVIPQGFKVAADSGLTVQEGIVIEDNDIKTGIGNNRGNQYVWIPVSNINGNGSNKIIKENEDGTTSEVEIILGRYTFGEDGTETLVQSGTNYKNETITETYYKELVESRTGVETLETDALNTTALNLEQFINSVNERGGYYIARYESSYGLDGKPNSKISDSYATVAPTKEGVLWNNITQIEAATACRELSTLYSNKINTDLVNSYAWDTAIVYIQECSKDTDYSNQVSLNSDLGNTGRTDDTRDEICKINDMASNGFEWTTEYSIYDNGTTKYPCVFRGGTYYQQVTNIRFPSFRGSLNVPDSYNNVVYRSILYL